MAIPITWRDTAAPKVANVLQFGADQVNKGLGGLSGQLANAASKMDTDQLNNALNQIQQLNQVGQAQGALDSGFIEGLGLRTPQQQIAARDALRNQVTTNRGDLRATQGFGDDTLRRDDVSTQNIIDEQRAAGDYEGANATADILNFGSGTTKLALGKEKKSEDILSANESFDQEITAAEIGRNKGLQQNNEVSENVLSQMPEALRNEVSLDEDGQLVFSDRIGAKPQEAILNAIESAGGYQDVAGYADIRQNAIANASPLVGAARIQEGQDQISGLQSKDPIYRQQAQQKLAMDTYNRGLADLKLEQVLKMNNITPPVYEGGDVTLTDYTQKYLEDTKDNVGLFKIGVGDYGQIVDATRRGLELARATSDAPINLDSVGKALSEMRAITKGQVEGNTGDIFQQLPAQDLADAIKKHNQTWYNTYIKSVGAHQSAKIDKLKTNLGIDSGRVVD